jgi:hypothetical protein
MDRPNTVSSLRAKREEMAKLHRHLISEAKTLLKDIEHVDATIRLFDPEAQLERISIDRYAAKHRAPKGELKRFVLTQFREAVAPLTSRQITEAWIEHRGIDGDRPTLKLIKTRVTAAIQGVKRDGLIEAVGQVDELKLWALCGGDK